MLIPSDSGHLSADPGTHRSQQATPGIPAIFSFKFDINISDEFFTQFHPDDFHYEAISNIPLSKMVWRKSARSVNRAENPLI